ncbi:MlaD family protein [Seonamhaeicola aphaedonensis]|uniref:Phospholipid/cholesterol/gamma-HCH transport system substrate-binding protein n=1 Tax=Seonamhaeicola aphaedonensis TaxID=1461338 RepID=A0A3D9HJ65_9FLAO|nr:MlaD family protein [Seonamhaeicola aphaedonensis]RED49530.1 phospholipid/cholesterol/gamma-HCH transport system substrate-binding protein [Seonamhaeicola aphaedonensis]
MKISKEVKTAVLVLSGIVLLIFGYNYLKGQNLLDSSRIFYTEYANVEGLTPSMPVTISGKVVGKVSKITFKDDGSANLIVELLVDSDFQFSKNSKAELYETGLIGGKAVAIVPAFDNAANAESGDTLAGSVQAGLSELVNQKLTPLQEKIEAVLGNTEQSLTNINEVFDDKTKVNLRNSIADLSVIISNFKDTSKSIDALVITNKDKLNSTLENVDNISLNFSKVSDSLVNTNIGQTIRNLESTLNNFNTILANMESGKGSMGKLLKDDALYNNLEGATGELEELLRDIKLHPKRYFRILSKKEIPYSEEENN